jgi:hypothetical protein
MVQRMKNDYLLISVKILNWFFRCVSVGTNSYTCTCLAGYTGTNCDTIVTGKINIYLFLSKIISSSLVNSCLQGTLTCYNGGT